MPPEVKVRLSVEGTPEALAAFRSVQQQAQSSGRAAAAGMAPLNASLSAMKSLLSSLGVAATLVAVVGKVIGEVKEAVDLGEKLGRTAERLVTAVKDFVPLALQAKTTGVEIDELEQKMSRFAKTLWELKAGNPEVVAGFRSIGLSAQSFKGRDLAQNFTIALTALGRVRDDYRKAAAAQLVFGKGSEDLIPLANDLARNGLDPLKARIGELFAEKDIARIRSTQDQLDLLNYTLKGVLVSAVAPAFAGQAENIRLFTAALIELNGVATEFNMIAAGIGLNARFWSLALIPLRDAIERAHQEIRELKLDLEELYAVGKAIARGDLAGVAKAGLIADAKLMASQAVHAEKIKAIWAERIPELPSAARPAPTEPPEPPTKPAKKPKPTGVTDAQLNAADQAELEAARAKNAAIEAEAKRAYDAGETSLRAYYTARRDTIESNLTAELELLAAEWKRAQKIKDPAQRDAALKAIGSQTDEAVAKADKARTELDASYLDERTKLEKTLTEIADKRRAAEEQEHQNKLREIAETQEAERKALVGLGETPATATAKSATDADVLRRAEDFRYQLKSARTELETLTNSDTLSDADVDRFKKLADQLKAAAAAIGPDAVASVAEFGHDIEEAGKKLAKETVELTDYGQAAAGALAQGFTDVGDEINSASAALLNFIRLLGKAVEQVAATRLAEKLVSYIPGLSTTKKASGGRIQKKAAGGLHYGPGTGTSDSILALVSNGEYEMTAQRTAERGALPFLEDMRRHGFLPALGRAIHRLVSGFAGGGPVVVPPRPYPFQAIDWSGARFRSFAQGGPVAPRPAPYQLRVPDWGNWQLRRYAEGSLVLGQRATSVTAHADVGGTIHVALDPGMIVAAMEAPAGQKVLVKGYVKHARTIRRVAGTG